MESNLHDSYILKSSGAIDIFSTEQITTNIDLELAPEMPFQICGCVLDHFTDGRGIGGAAVLIYGKNNEFVGKTFTDASGYFIFTGLPGGLYKLTANKEGYQTASFIPVTLEAGVPVSQDILLPPVQSGKTLVYGRVSNHEGVPLENAAVSLVTKDGRAAASTVTSARGEYAVYGLPDGGYSVIMSADGYTSRRFEAVISPESGNVNINAALPPVSAPPDAAAISGFVTNSQGAPIASAWVGLYAVSPGSQEKLVATATTNNDGFYIFVPVAEGQYIIKSKAMVV